MEMLFIRKLNSVRSVDFIHSTLVWLSWFTGQQKVITTMAQSNLWYETVSDAKTDQMVIGYMAKNTLSERIISNSYFV